MKGKIAKILFKMLSKLSIKTSHKIATFIGTITYFLPSRESKVTKININKVFADKSTLFKDKLIKQSLIESSKSVLESMPIWQLGQAQINQLLKIHGAEYINNQQGIIFVVPHFASWEIINLWLSSQYQLSSLYRTPKVASMNEVMLSARQKFNSKMVADNLKGVMTLKKTLSQNQKILIAPDQDPGESGSVIADFFNIPTRSSTLVPKLAKKTKSKILLIYTIRKRQNFDLHIIKPQDKVYSENITTAVNALNQDLEAIIMQAPEQYAWSYKRFRYQKDHSKLYG